MIWRILAFILSRRSIAAWLITRAKRTPYSDLHTDGRTIWRVPAGTALRFGHMPYMRRWWLFRTKWAEARIHCIQHPDPGRDPHNHPWPFRTIVLKGHYFEQRDGRRFLRPRGATYRLEPHQFHRITSVPTYGAWTLFITFGKRGSWGFSTPAGVVDHDEYSQ